MWCALWTANPSLTGGYSSLWRGRLSCFLPSTVSSLVESLHAKKCSGKTPARLTSDQQGGNSPVFSFGA
eukprot:1245238-Amphidinium_carterae.1